MAVVLVLIFFPVIVLISRYLEPAFFLVIGSVMGIAAVALTAGLVILCLRRHGKPIAGESLEVGKVTILEIPNHAGRTQDRSNSNHNPYIKGIEPVVAAGLACPQHNEPQTSQQRKVSISSDYTESHYYTEIDEYFINKRIAKKQQKLQNCHENATFKEDILSPEKRNHMDTNTYDYAYDKSPK